MKKDQSLSPPADRIKQAGIISQKNDQPVCLAHNLIIIQDQCGPLFGD